MAPHLHAVAAAGRHQFVRRRGALAFVLLFWGLQFTSLTIERMLAETGDTGAMLLPRFCVVCVAVCLSLLIAEAHERLAGRSLRARLVAAVALAMVGALTHAAANYTIFQLFLGARNFSMASFPSYLMAIVQWFWSYAAISGILLAFAYSLEIGRLQHLTQSAQLRALRYQLNPHFMFNTLNSIAALISQGDKVAAERMVESLADFLRASLSLDPQEDIPLRREIHLQSLYLEIEGLRFADRLKAQVVVPPDVEDALVPSLITQPLAENMIRHAVSNSIRPIEFVLSARRENGHLHVSAYNSAPDDGGRCSPGTGIGLANIAERLRARYGASASFKAERQADGGFLAEFEIPFTTDRSA
ncbi:MAG: histidine kinase [Alphaproteobacteria bacterium]|nr:histidine kinase [Alphaproteobacteria bacterium]